MNFRKLNFENTLIILAFIFALSIRFLNLGTAPLSESEAAWALQALKIARPAFESGNAAIGSQPAYIFLTGASFYLFSASNFVARFWPTLAGSFLVLLPILFHRKLGRWVTIILSFGLALDPGLVTVSRQAGGPMMALSFSLLALGFYSQRKWIPAGILGGLAFLSGPAAITGLLGLGLAWILVRVILPGDKDISKGASFEKTPDLTDDSLLPDYTGLQDNHKSRWLFVSAIFTILIVGTLFFRYPQGLVAWFNTLPDYLEGWLIPSGIPSLQLLFALIFYQPLALAFALVAAIRWIINLRKGKQYKTKTILFCIFWVLVSLILALIYPSRQVSDLVWMLVPLWTLASIELHYYIPDDEPKWIAMLETGLIILLAVLFWNTLIATNRIVPSPEIPWVSIRIAVLTGIIALGALTTILIGLGWSWKAARLGLVWGLVLVFSINSFASMWGATQLRSNQPHEFWGYPPGTGQTSIFTNTLADLSNWTTGFPKQLSVVSTINAPSIYWILRDFKNVHFTAQPQVGDLPEVIITRQDQEIPELAASYRGQDFIWWVWRGWHGSFPSPIIDWVTYRQAPLVNEYIILWARSDIFPGGTIEPSVEQIESE